MVRKFDRIWKLKLPTSFSANLWQFGNKMSFYFEMLYFCVVKVLKNWKYQQMLKILIRNMFWDQNIAFSTQKIFFCKNRPKNAKTPHSFTKLALFRVFCGFSVVHREKLQPPSTINFFPHFFNIIYFPKKVWLALVQYLKIN